MVDFAKKVQKKAMESLLPGEQVLAAAPWQKRGALGKQVAFSSAGLVGAAVHAAANRNKDDATAVTGPSADALNGRAAILAVTDHRVIAFSQTPMGGNPKDVIGQWEHREIDSLELDKNKLTYAATLRFADGSVAEGEFVRAAKPEKLVDALS